MSQELLNRAQILMQQKRHAEAEKILVEALGQDPVDPYLLGMMAEVQIAQGKAKKALEFVNKAIGSNPDIGFLHYIKARALLLNDNFDGSEASLRTAVAIDPQDDDAFALLANIRLNRKNYNEALEYAEEALAINPENLLALNTKSSTLVKLDKKEEAFETIEGALNEDPNSAYTHANYGWGLLEKGEHKKALTHFAEALKNDPNNQFAQAGMAEAIKARYLIYRLYLKYAFWMSNLTEKYQWGVIIGFYLVYRVLSSAARENETLAPFITPILVVMFIIAFSSWVLGPLANLFLRLNKYGQHLLSKKEKLSSNFVGLSLLTSVAGLILFIMSGTPGWMAMAFFGFTMMIPCSAMFSHTKTKNALVYYTIAMAFVGGVSVMGTFQTGELFSNFTVIYLLGIFAFQWIANFVVIREDNR
ncbi:MAG: tetratricopeptide repeat protein [Bacteroidota bacterium]